jgi:hypothetical protein
MKIYGLLAVILLYCLAPLNGQNTTDSTATQKDTTCKDCKETRNVHTTVYKTKRYEIRGFMVDLGISTYLNNGNFNLPQSLDVYELNYDRSYHLNVRVFEQRINFDKKGYTSISQGLNLEWQNYNFVNDYVFEPRQSMVTPILSDKRLSKNRLLTQLVSLPVEFHIESNPKRLSRSFHISAGVIGGLVYRANQKIKYEDDGDKNKVRDDFNLNKFRLGWIGRIGYGPINFYVSNSLTPLFKSGEGPELIPLQIGVTLIPY